MNDRNNESVWEIFIFFIGFGILIVGISLFFMMMEVHTILPTENDQWLFMKTASDLNVREFPHTHGNVVEVLPEGTIVYVQVPEVRGYDSWGRICLQDGEYWVNCYFLVEATEEEYEEKAYAEEEYEEEAYEE